MRPERRWLLWLACVLSGLVTLPALAAPAAPTLLPEEYTVLTAVVSHGLPADTKSIVIAAQTTGDPSSVVPPGADLEALAKRLDTTPALLAAWAALNRQVAKLEQKFELKMRYELLDEVLRARIFDDEDPVAGWERFAKRFPQSPGWLRVSRVALDEAHLNALVYVEFACGAECGTGRLIRLTKTNGLWVVLSGELMWVAGD